MNCLRGSFAPYWQSIQRALFPQLEPVLGPLTGKQQQLVQTLDVKGGPKLDQSGGGKLDHPAARWRV